MKDLYEDGYAQVMVEAGPKLVSQFIEQDLVDQLIIYQAPKMIGGQENINIIKRKMSFLYPIVNYFKLYQQKSLVEILK